MVDERVCINNFCVCLICYGLMLLVAHHNDTGSTAGRPALIAKERATELAYFFRENYQASLLSRGVPQRSQLLLRPGIVL